MPLRIVLDTNVLIAAIIWRGTAWRLLAAAQDGRYQLVVSADLLDELRDKLADEKFRPSLEVAGLAADVALLTISSIAREVTPGPVPPVDLRDPTDLHVLAAALGGADIIVSRDRDLLSLGAFEGIPIMGVEDCLHTLGLHG